MSDQSLTAKKCQPCEGMGAPLSAESVKPFFGTNSQLDLKR